MSININAYMFRGYKIPSDAVTQLPIETYENFIDNNKLYPLNYYDEGDFIFGNKICEITPGDAKAFNPYEFETCHYVNQDRELMLKAIELFKGYLPHTYPKIYCGLVVE